MNIKMVRERIVFGGWYQRTTLHLSEIHRFLLNGASDLDLNKAKLKTLRNGLELESVKRVVGYLEYLEWETKSGIRVKYFEDGLYVLSEESNDVDKSKRKIKKYFDEKFEPAVNYLFSLGAPTPKILSNMKETHPFVIEKISQNPNKFKVDKKFGEVYSEASSSRIKVVKTKDNILVIINSVRKKEIEMLTEMQIFFSDFKLQLHKYLNVHRKIWEDISEIKDRGFVRGSEVNEYRTKLESYKKSIQLIQNRINQMDNYAKTRAEISERVKIDKYLNSLFQYRFEDLFNTLSYIKEVWKMTLDYVDSGIEVMNEINKKSTNEGLKSIQLLVSIGVIAGIVRYLNPKYLPVVTTSTILFIVGLGIFALGIDYFIKWSAKRKQYELKFVERNKKI